MRSSMVYCNQTKSAAAAVRSEASIHAVDAVLRVATRTRLSIIVPTRRMDEALSARIGAFVESNPTVEFLVVEPDDLAPGASEPADSASPIRRPETSPFRLLRAPRGRGSQCNAGARAASADLLLFLHDDTELPIDALSRIDAAFQDADTDAACFRLRFDQDHWLLRTYAAFSRFDSVLTTFGDQGFCMRRCLFDAVDGFPNWPLFEDVELARRIRRRTRIVKLACAVTTSAIRFQQNGMLIQQLFNARLILRFLFGAKPDDLASRYERNRLRSQAKSVK